MVIVGWQIKAYQLLVQITIFVLSGSNNLHLAPKVKVVDGFIAVPIDIQYLDAKIIFDIKSRRAQVEATMRFIVGETGNPIFDLRQDITKAILNGEQLDVNKLKHHNFGGGPNAELIILERIVSPENENALKLIYELDKPKCPKSKPIEWQHWNSDDLYFDFLFSDLNPARYLEMWFPSNLIYDQFRFNLNISIINTEISHNILSNGKINTLDKNQWLIEFPETFTSFSPMLCIVPTDKIERSTSVMTFQDVNVKIQLDICKMKTTAGKLEDIERDLRTHISDNVTKIGPYIHGDRFTTFIWDINVDHSGMEYDGGTTTKLEYLKHEVYHSWFARGLKPATQNDAWMDEGWTQYKTSNQTDIAPYTNSDPAIMLSTSNPYIRITPNKAYEEGSRFFATLASKLGDEKLDSYMSSFYIENKGNLVATDQLMAHLINRSNLTDIEDYFRRFVYGFDNPI